MSSKYVKMNPQLWQYGQYKVAGMTLTHEPQEVSGEQLETLLQLRFKGKKLVVEVDKKDLTHEEQVELGLWTPPKAEASVPEKPKPSRRSKPTTTPDEGADEVVASDE